MASSVGEGLGSPAIEQDPSVAQLQAAQLGQQAALAVGLPAAGFVASINTLSGAIRIVPGANIAVTSDGVVNITISATGFGALATVKCNYTAILPPTPGNDEFEGYSVGSEWLDTVATIFYKCASNATASAVWVALN